jgi:integrase
MLTDAKCKNAKPKSKPYKLSDERSMYLLVDTNGSKYFRLKYKLDGKENVFSIGVYPYVSLKLAREIREEAKKLIANNIDPNKNRQQAKNNNALTFEKLVKDWIQSCSHRVSKETNDKKIRRLEIHSFPTLGDMCITTITPQHVFSVIKPLITRHNLETAHRVCSEINCAFKYAKNHNLLLNNPAEDVSLQIPPLKVTNRAAITEEVKVGQLLRDIWHYDGTPVVKYAFRISPLLFQRPGEIRQMEWKDIDFEKKQWRYLVTKTQVDHIVPLSKQVLDILECIKPFTSDNQYVFPSARNDGRPMSENAIRTALRTLGYSNDEMTPHGFRSIASTILNEHGWDIDAIERQLCHMPRDKVRAAYNRAQLLPLRTQMMQWWADYLDKLRDGTIDEIDSNIKQIT